MGKSKKIDLIEERRIAMTRGSEKQGGKSKEILDAKCQNIGRQEKKPVGMGRKPKQCIHK
jgi:hypothetical protein